MPGGLNDFPDHMVSQVYGIFTFDHQIHFKSVIFRRGFYFFDFLAEDKCAGSDL